VPRDENGRVHPLAELRDYLLSVLWRIILPFHLGHAWWRFNVDCRLPLGCW
jgi:hypothetical protein